MASNLRRMVVLGPSGTINPGGSHDYRNASNRLFFSDTRTRWARFWADWATLDAARLAALDAQIARAKRDGLQVILTLYRFPTWANGTGALTPEQLAATMSDRKTANDPETKAKSLLLRYPDDVSETSVFGRFLTTLVSRYSRNNARRPVLDAVVDFIEVCNEPNYMWWPQQAPSADPANPYATSTITIADVVARMFVTAQRITARYGGEPMLCGPGTADTTDGGRLRTAYHSFTERLLPALTAAGFVAGPRFAWSHHNYTDVTYDMGPGSTFPGAATDPTRLTNRAADTRRRLVGRWAGWPAADAANPQILLTEGGVTLPNIAARWGITDRAAQLAKQSELVQRKEPDGGEHRRGVGHRDARLLPLVHGPQLRLRPGRDVRERRRDAAGVQDLEGAALVPVGGGAGARAVR
jgi:hypothetical protein